MPEQPATAAVCDRCGMTAEDHVAALCRLCSAPTCPTQTPEPHLLGEFPMTCYACHVEADS